MRLLFIMAAFPSCQLQLADLLRSGGVGASNMRHKAEWVARRGGFGSTNRGLRSEVRSASVPAAASICYSGLSAAMMLLDAVQASTVITSQIFRQWKP